MLREDAYLLQQQGKNLFGKKFREHLITSAKSNKHIIELFYDKDKKIHKTTLAGISKYFVETLKILTKDSESLEYVKGYKIPF